MRVNDDTYCGVFRSTRFDTLYHLLKVAHRDVASEVLGVVSLAVGDTVFRATYEAVRNDPPHPAFVDFGSESNYPIYVALSRGMRQAEYTTSCRAIDWDVLRAVYVAPYQALASALRAESPAGPTAMVRDFLFTVGAGTV